jgi:hypothetical protein
LARTVGGALISCVPGDRLASAIPAALQPIPPGTALDEQQLNCVGQQVAAGDRTAIAGFIGGVAIGTPVMIVAGAGPIDAACGTSMAR